MGFREHDFLVEGDGNKFSSRVFLPLLDESDVNIVKDGGGGSSLGSGAWGWPCISLLHCKLGAFLTESLCFLAFSKPVDIISLSGGGSSAGLADTPSLLLAGGMAGAWFAV